MKKIVITAMSFAAVSLMFVACNKEDAQEPLEAGTAQISGKLFANLDETSVQKQTVPAGTGITFIVDGRDLDHNPSTDTTFEYKKRTIRATADADGNYSASLPAISRPYEVEVIFDDFEYEATIITTNDEGFQEVVTERRTFSMPSTTIAGVVEGKTIVKNYDYGLADDQDFVAGAAIRGDVDAIMTDNVGEVTNFNNEAIVNDGSDYETGEATISGGSGTGMVINITGVDGDGAITAYEVTNGGEGYEIGEEVTVDGGSNGRIEIARVNPQEEAVPANVVLSFSVNGQEFKTVTDDDGKYIIKVPTGAVTVSGLDFEAPTVYEEGDEYITGDKIYSYVGGNLNVAEGAIEEFDITYTRKN